MTDEEILAAAPRKVPSAAWYLPEPGYVFTEGELFAFARAMLAAGAREEREACAAWFDRRAKRTLERGETRTTFDDAIGGLVRSRSQNGE
jgi:hypothetical protein